MCVGVMVVVCVCVGEGKEGREVKCTHGVRGWRGRVTPAV